MQIMIILICVSASRAQREGVKILSFIKLTKNVVSLAGFNTT